jgi:hypothetical protein
MVAGCTRLSSNNMANNYVVSYFVRGVIGGLSLWERNTNYRVCRCSCRLVSGRCWVWILAATQTVPTESFCGFLEHLQQLLRCDLDWSTICSFRPTSKSSYSDRPNGHAVFRVWGVDVKYTTKGRKNCRYLKALCLVKLQVFEGTAFSKIAGIWRHCVQ